ncbi:MAG TPA: hypothetical protein PKW15_04365 [Alphaproteobacteria bacterium]|nr:hypothetical protein [Rhodospirillaceae bacterium]HRJ12460.1 hypothetical protein [Alphaproteobacteria bacterium]
MIKKTSFIFAAAILAAVAFFANEAIAQGAATAAAGNVTYQDICVTDPNAKLTPSVKPRKKIANVAKTAPVQARSKKLAKARKKKPVDPVKVSDICPPGQKPMKVSFVTPVAPVPVMSLCQTALGASANVTASQASGMLMNAGLNDTDYAKDGMLNVAMVDDKEELAQAVSAAIKANPDAAPAILAFVVRGLNPQDTEALQAVTKAAYNAAPGQAAGLTYAAVSTNKNQTIAITQAMLGAASQADDSVIRQCAVDANPDLANEIATAAFVPTLGTPTIDQNDIRNTVRDTSGPGPDGSGA